MLIKLPFTVRRQNRIRNFLQLLLINMSISCCDSKNYCYVLGCSAKSFLTALVIHEDFFFVCVWARRSSADSWLIGFFSNHFQFKIICCSFKFWCRCKREREKDSQKIMISLRWDRAREKKVSKLLSGWTKSITKKVMRGNRFFFCWNHSAGRCTHKESYFWDCTGTTDNRRWEEASAKQKTTSEIREQIKYFINYLYFHNMII